MNPHRNNPHSKNPHKDNPHRDNPRRDELLHSELPANQRWLRGSLWPVIALALMFGFLLIGSAIFSAPPAAAADWCDRDPEVARKRINLLTNLVMRWVDTTDDQRQQVSGIIDDLIEDIVEEDGELYGMAKTHCRNREKFKTVFSSNMTDRDRLYNQFNDIRKAELALAEQASERFVSALADIAAVLSPDQRLELMDIAEDFRSYSGNRRGFNRW